MLYTTLGRTNLKVSRFCLGTMMFGGKTSAEESIAITRRAVDAGVNFIDTANVYTETRCESIVGEALAEGGLRDKVVLATKAGMKVGTGPNDTGISRWHFVRAVEDSLRRLRTDRIDLYYIHWPFVAMELDEVLRTIDDLVRQGKVLYAGCSNFPAWLVTRCLWLAEVKNYVPLVAAQYPYNLIERGLELEILPMAKALGVGITLYRPLAIGVLTAKYLQQTPDDTRGQKDERIGRWTQAYANGLRQLQAFAQEHGFTAAAAANAWAASHPAVTSVIVGVSRLEQLEANLRGMDWQLTPEQRDALAGHFDSAVWEEAGGQFPNWRRSYDIIK